MLGVGWPVPQNVDPGPEWATLLAAAFVMAVVAIGVIESYRRPRPQRRIRPAPEEQPERRKAA